MSMLELSTHRLPGCTVIRVVGDVDITTATKLDLAVEEGLLSGEPLILDVGDMAFLDSTGLSVLLKAHVAAERDGGGLHVAAPQPVPRRIFQVTGVLSHLHLYDSLDEAIRVAVPT
ncbi:MAG: STAS domain-containing protein [Nonomuraea sp.]|nr:STAS domain-containing protein [Nonomuraea sp.]